MDNKFYVSLEAARLLKEKGCGRDVNNYYDENGFLHYLEYDENYNYFQMSNNDLDLDHYAAPTKAEAIDWLESKGIYIELMFNFKPSIKDHEVLWCYNVYNKIERLGYKENNIFHTRLEAEETAIIKALELLTIK